jgi:hypothetical protein
MTSTHIEPSETDYRAIAQAYGRLTAFMSRLYLDCIAAEGSLTRQLASCERSRAEVALAKVPQLQSLLDVNQAMTCGLELLLQKTLKEERLLRLSDELRVWFEAVYSSAEGEQHRAS